MINFDEYRTNGGTYVIPCEILDEFIGEIEQLKDKAIEYIEWQEKNPQYDNVWRSWECKSLIKILMGDK